MKVKLFSVQAKNRKPKPSFDTLEKDVNAWLADHPNIVVEHTNDVTQPSAVWSHLALAVWYSEEQNRRSDIFTRGEHAIAKLGKGLVN